MEQGGKINEGIMRSCEIRNKERGYEEKEMGEMRGKDIIMTEDEKLRERRERKTVIYGFGKHTTLP